MCGDCDKRFATNEEVTNHKREAHDKVTFQCDVCRNDFVNKDDMQKHTSENHYDATEELLQEEEVLQEAAEEQDLYEILEKLTEEVVEPEIEQYEREELILKITAITMKLKNKDTEQNHMILKLCEEKKTIRELKNKPCEECKMRNSVEETATRECEAKQVENGNLKSPAKVSKVPERVYQ